MREKKVKENWIEKFEKNYPSDFEKKMAFIGEFKKRVFKRFGLKKYRPEFQESERWGYSQKSFGYLDDFCNEKTYRIDLDSGEIKLVKTYD